MIKKVALVLIFCSFIITTNIYATSVTTQTNSEQNSILSSHTSESQQTNQQNELHSTQQEGINEITISTGSSSIQTEQTESSNAGTGTAARTNSTYIQSVNEVNNEQASSNLGISIIVNIILIAVGFVLILLAIAILIRIK